MFHLGIFTGKDLKSKSLDFLETHFNKSGNYYYHIDRGIHYSEVKPYRAAKSVAAEHTFRENLTSEKLEDRIRKMTKELEK